MEKQKVEHGELDYMRDNAGYNNCNCKLMITNKMKNSCKIYFVRMKMLQPIAANCRQYSQPIPDVPPVTNALYPFMSVIYSLFALSVI